jgi:hypothetical protein
VAHPKLHLCDPNCQICAANMQPQQQTLPSSKTTSPRIPIPMSRTIPIPWDNIALNAEGDAAMHRAKPIWQ